MLFDFLHHYVQVYLENIFIYHKKLQDHSFYICQVLQFLQKAKLQANIDKCEFHIQETKFLGFIVSIKHIQIYPQKVSTI